MSSPIWKNWQKSQEKIRIGISTCLLGEKVRYDGGHKRDHFAVDILSLWVEMIPVCPEVEIGMGIPRPTIRLEGDIDTPRLVEPKSGRDFTEKMQTYAKRRIKQLKKLDLDGYILKKSSPSCGMERVRVFNAKGIPARKGRGIYAAALFELWPNLPIEEEGRLNDPGLRELFIERVFCRNRWRNLIKSGKKRGALVAFHTAHKLLIRAHNERAYQELGKIVALGKKIPIGEQFDRYEETFFQALQTKATIRRHFNNLQHMAGYLKRELDKEDKAELAKVLEDYKTEIVPLIVPLTLLRFLAKKHGISYLEEQLYLEPHPKELMLRNHT
jgi:uncharacterized protein YbbK (DUF523 family)/uncharacterized protein YbgA (DUF1722 family)